MKLNLCKCSAVLLNLFEGVAAVIALAVIYSFLFEAANSNHSIGMGLLVLLVWLAVLCIPNLLFRIYPGFRRKDGVLFQLVPFLAGAILYILFQIVIL